MIATTRDGRTLHYERRGSGAPIVVFDAGMGGNRLWWGSVAPKVATHTTTVAYDRSGLGRSPADTEPRTLDRLARDLLDLLAEVGGGPFVLVAHSWGGPVIRCATALAPELVGGLVLVDATDEGCDLFFGRAATAQNQLFVATLPAMARIGLLGWGARSVGRSLPPEDAAALRAEEGTPAHAQAMRAELVASTDDLRSLRDAPLPVPDVPLTIISGTKSSPLGRRRRTALVEAHRARADAAPQGRHVLAQRSAHLVPLTEPELVAGEILRVVDAVREATPS